MPTLDIPKESPQHARILARLSSRIKLARQEQQKHHTRWRDAERRVMAYVPENLADNNRRIRRDNGEPQYTTIQVPYTYAVVMTAHTYWTSVFFARSPVHQFAGRHGQGEMQTQALEALIQYQVDVGRMTAPYYLWLYDAAKYGIGILGSYWDQKVIQYGSLELVGDKFQHVSRAVMGYTGTCGYNVSPFDWFPDPRVTADNFQKGEFCAVLSRLAWHEVQKRKDSGDYMNVDKLPLTPQGVNEYDSGDTDGQVARPEDSWELANDVSVVGGKQNKHPARIRIYEVYVELTPSEWGVGTGGGSEKWIFTVTADLSLIIGARPLGAIHGQFPFSVAEPELEAYGMMNRGFPEMVQPLQQTMDWLLNTHMYNIRAALNNQFIIDPSRVNIQDMKKGGPGFTFRLKPEAFGQDVRTAIHQIPIQDVTGTHMSDLGNMFSIGERTFGINEQMFGMLSQGSTRRSATEVRSATGFAVNRQKTQVEWLSASSFSDHAAQMVAMSQQYYTGEQKFRIVGDLALNAGSPFMQVTPENIAGQFDYVAVDGTLPIDRFAQVTMWKDMLAGLTASDMGMQVMMQYDLGKIFGWLFSLGGIKNINQFKVQVLPPGAMPGPGMMATPDIGTNVVPMPRGQASNMTGGDALSAAAAAGGAIDGTYA